MTGTRSCLFADTSQNLEMFRQHPEPQGWQAGSGHGPLGTVAAVTAMRGTRAGGLLAGPAIELSLARCK